VKNAAAYSQGYALGSGLGNLIVRARINKYCGKHSEQLLLDDARQCDHGSCVATGSEDGGRCVARQTLRVGRPVLFVLARPGEFNLPKLLQFHFKALESSPFSVLLVAPFLEFHFVRLVTDGW